MEKDINKSVKSFAMIGFLLLAILFGMQIMTFIFGNLGSSIALDDDSFKVQNESGSATDILNDSGFALDQSLYPGFNNPSMLEVYLANGSDVPSSQYSISSIGILTNASGNYTSGGVVNVSYTFTGKSDAQIQIDRTNNDSLVAIGNYATQSGTQFTTLGIAITLVILVAVFIFFWAAFMGSGKDSIAGGGNFG